MIKILIADDHLILRAGLKAIISEIEDIQVLDEASTGKEVLEKISSNIFDVILLDISMPDGNGLETIRQMRGDGIKTPVLILSMHSEDQYALRTIKAGGNGYITKESAPEELIGAIRAVAVGRRYISEDLATQMALALDENEKVAPHERLASREYEVMLLIAKGDSTKDIAKYLGLSPKTISTYRSRIFEKMQMSKNAELIRYALINHLID